MRRVLHQSSHLWEKASSLRLIPAYNPRLEPRASSTGSVTQGPLLTVPHRVQQVYGGIPRDVQGGIYRGVVYPPWYLGCIYQVYYTHQGA